MPTKLKLAHNLCCAGVQIKIAKKVTHYWQSVLSTAARLAVGLRRSDHVTYTGSGASQAKTGCHRLPPSPWHGSSVPV